MAVTPFDRLYPKTPWLYVLYKRGMADRSCTMYIARVGIFDLFCSRDLDLNSMTFIYELDPYSLEIYWMSKYELSTSKLSKVFV